MVGDATTCFAIELHFFKRLWVKATSIDNQITRDSSNSTKKKKPIVMSLDMLKELVFLKNYFNLI
jgi:hypothetical protein